MPSISNSFEYIFKERRGLSKFLLPFLVMFVLVAVLVLMVFALILPAFTLGVSDSESISALMLGTSAIPFFGFAILLMAISLVYAVVISWYEYENIQAGMENRPTEYLWREKITTTLKRSLKLFLVNLIYTLPVVVVTVFLSIVISIFAPTSFGTLSQLTTQNIIYLVINYFLTFVVALLALVYNCYITIPAKLRLVSTNTFMEAFNFQHNMKLVKHNINKFGLLALYYIAYSVVIYIIGTLISFISGVLPVIAVCFASLSVIVLALLSYHISTFVIPHFLGAFYRTLKR